MKILIVNMSVDAVLGGGTVERTRQLAKELQKLPHTEAKVLSTTANLNDEEVFKDKQYILLPCMNKRWYVPAPYFGKIYRSIKWADAVVIIGHWTLLNALVYWVNKLVGRPYLFCPAGALHIFGRSGFFKRAYNALVGNAILKHADAVIAIPKDEIKLFYKLGVDNHKLALIPNGISPEDFKHHDTMSIRAKHGLGEAPFLLFVGRLNEIKGPDILMDAFLLTAKQFPDWHLVFAGPDGGMEVLIKSTAQGAGLGQNVHFLGFVSGNDKSGLYHAASILVVPSRLEAMSIVALEAAICATPVVMTNECGFSELVDAGGALEVPVTSEALAEAMNTLMGNANMLGEMGLKAKSFIQMNYTWTISAQKHRDLCEKVCSEV
ncbi:glycosyltransferase [Ghiorsea bivora]|uniref:glycosyltransferase n=1 Tax=Ghiorsea bivora TaxID=1485545 RepID=UPI000571940D|nr:glycosyltransferase [Ghiorsea bivora]